MNVPKLSVIIPFYNASQFLRRSLDSVMKQTFKDIEVILVNDGSTDNSQDIAAEYLDSSLFVMLINIKRGGVSKARNIGLKRARGGWVAFMDADDWVEEDFYESYFKVVSSSVSCDIIFSGYIRELPLGDYRTLSLVPGYVEKKDLSKTIEYLNKTEALGWAWNKLFKRSIIEQQGIRFDPTVSLREDELFTLMYCRHVHSIQIISDSLYHYMINDNSLVHRKRNYIDYQRTSDLLYKEYSRYFDNEEFRKYYQQGYASGIFYALTTMYTGETKATKKQRLSFICKFLNFRSQLDIKSDIRYKANKWKNLLFKTVMSCGDVNAIDFILKFLVNRL